MPTPLIPVEKLDGIYVYEGTPPTLRASGPYSVEAFFSLTTPHEQVLGPVCWLIENEVPHEAKIETLVREEGFFLQISFPTDEFRNSFLQRYKYPAH
jgi:hypothetical protein